MKSIRSVLLVGAVLAASILWVHAQVTNSTPYSAEDIATMLEAIEQTTPTAFGSLPDSGLTGTFWSAQHAPGTASAWPPLPADIYDLDAWPLGDGQYLLNDTNFDFDAFADDIGAGTFSPMARFSMVAGGLASSYAYGNPVYLTNMTASLASDHSITAAFSIAGGTNFVPYDILMTTNLV